MTGTVILNSAGKSMAGMHAVSGAWVEEKTQNISENDLLVTFEETADGLKMSQPTGHHIDARLDGKDYPFEGAAEVNKVVVKRIGPRAIEEIDKRDECLE